MTRVDPELIELVRGRLADSGGEVDTSTVAALLRAEGRLVGHRVVLDLVEALQRDACGAGALDPLLRAPGVTDVLVNGPDRVYVDRGHGLETSHVRFPDDAAVRRLAQRLAASAGRRLDDASPSVDVRLRDGSRFHAVLAPVAGPGTCLSIRVPARTPMTLDDLTAAGTMTEATAALLRDLMAARAAFVVSGGTGSGKTTLLGALLSCIDPAERIVLVEDARELRPDHPHVVSMEARQANVEGVGEISLQHLVKQALRMRPDRLVVGEVRGRELVDMLAAMNTGHEGGCGTIHANSASAVPARFEALGLAAGLPREAVHSQVASAVDVVLHVRRERTGARRLHQVAVLERGDDGYVSAVPAVTFEADGEISTGPAARSFEEILVAGASC